MSERKYLSIDLKSFFASVECRERGLDPLNTNLVVADETRTDKTICLAATPTLKSYGISGRSRLFEVKQCVSRVNSERSCKALNKKLEGSSCIFSELQQNPSLAVDFIIAPPRMAYYIKYSTQIYEIYMKYVAPEDIVVYSIDEVFMDVTNYLEMYKLSARGLAQRIIQDVLRETGITATAGIGTNLYLCKVAMDIVAKHIPADENGVRIAELDEMSYRKTLWAHEPITDFWRVGKGTAERLKSRGIYTMGDIARVSIHNEDLFYSLFGKGAELLIDHAWGWEPCTIDEIKAYRPETNSSGSGQVLHIPYEADKARLVLLEMADLLALDLVDKGIVTNQLVVTVGYDIENLTDPSRRSLYHGEIVSDRYGRQIPKNAHGTINLSDYTSSAKKLMDAAGELFDKIVNPTLLIRRLNITANNVIVEEKVESGGFEQLDFFTDYAELDAKKEAEREQLDRERRTQLALIKIKKKFGRNAVLKGMNLEEGATAKDRNGQIGGHKA